MRIKRIQVEEGWLNGLDLTFAEGLNVIIGPRGTGKSSIVELIRYCLGISAYTDSFDQVARNHALTVLGSGQVSLTIEHDGASSFIARTREEAEQHPSYSFPPPIILSQNEIEKVAIHESGRLRLLDTFLESPERTSTEEEALLAKLASQTTQMQSVKNEIEDLHLQLSNLSTVDQELADAEKEQEALAENVSDLENLQLKLDEIAQKSAPLAVRIDLLKRTTSSINDLRERISGITQYPPTIEAWPPAAGPKDEIGGARKAVESSIAKLRGVNDSLSETINELQQSIDLSSQERLELEAQARELRQEIESIQVGAGALARRVADLKEQRGQAEALVSLREDRQKSIELLKEGRVASLSELDVIREARYRKRAGIAENLNTQLSPLIEASVLRSAIFDEYESAISETLRGSGLHYSVLAPALAKNMSPRELGEAIEERDAATISDLGGITEERAHRLISYASTVGVQSILSCHVDDGVRFKLLVGKDYKSTERLSTGQRCTVILPILLSEHGRALIIDQPEDNLDNAFIVDTVVKAIRSASSAGQIICSTHNPNIPVLGEAEQVVLLGSDGSRGFVRDAAPLDDPRSIEAITSVMEGGREAFQKRAEFYRIAEGDSGG